MQRYDPLVAPDLEEWLALDEGERIDLARDYHRKARIRLPNARVHATVHAIVETQIALGDKTPARRTEQRFCSRFTLPPVTPTLTIRGLSTCDVA
jgi:hypothetical protein